MIERFQGGYRFLSNFFEPAPVWYEDELYPSVEHAYQAAKTLDEEKRSYVREAPSAKEAKKRGRGSLLRPDWEDTKLDVMLELVRQKFQHPRLGQQLLQTGDEELVEGNWWGDTFWGVCKGEGQNHLGRILMQVRDELRTTTRPGVRTRPTTVVHCKHDSYDVYIGRPSDWGNPYSHKRGSAPYMVRTREDAVEAYEEYIRAEPELLARLHELRGKRLGCWCAPQLCHGDVLVKLIEEQEAKMIVAVTGGRDIAPTEEELTRFVQWCHHNDVDELRHGDCDVVQRSGKTIVGVDKAVAEAAWDHGIRAVLPYPAEWDKHGRAAGPLRNKEMLMGRGDEGLVDVLVAWPGGRGTEDCKRRAQNLGVEVIEIDTLKKDKDMAKKKSTKKAPKKKSKKTTSKKKTSSSKKAAAKKTSSSKKAASKKTSTAVAKSEPPKAEVISLPDLAFMDGSREKELEDDYQVLLEFVVDDKDDFAFAAEQLKEDNKELKAWEDKEKDLTKDLTSALRKTRDLFRPRKKWLKKKVAAWKEAMVAFENRAHAEQHRALSEAAAASKAGDREAHKQALAEAAQAEVPSIDGVTTRYTWDFEVEDMKKVPLQFLVVDTDAVMAMIKKHQGDVEIPGIKVIRKASIAASRV